MKKILITGGDGFLAKSLREKLVGDYKIISCNRLMLDLNSSVAVHVYLKKEQFDVVIHTATYDAAPKGSLKDKNKVLENNLNMFFNLARCQDYFGKMIYFGSGAEFSREHWKPKMSEDYFDQHVPPDQYGFSKYMMTKYALQADNIINLRLFGVFGEYDDWRYRFIPNICAHAVLNMPINVHKNSRVDFLYINDLVKIVQWFIDNKSKYQVYNTCSGTVFSYVEIAKEIITLSGKNLDFVVNDIELSNEYSGSNNLLLQEIGGFDFSFINKSLIELYSWYMKNKGEIVASKFHY